MGFDTIEINLVDKMKIIFGDVIQNKFCQDDQWSDSPLNS